MDLRCLALGHVADAPTVHMSTGDISTVKGRSISFTPLLLLLLLLLLLFTFSRILYLLGELIDLEETWR